MIDTVFRGLKVKVIFYLDQNYLCQRSFLKAKSQVSVLRTIAPLVCPLMAQSDPKLNDYYNGEIFILCRRL